MNRKLRNLVNRGDAVAEETALPYPKVLSHIKYDRLALALQTMVHSGEVGLEVALRAHSMLSMPRRTRTRTTQSISLGGCRR